MVKSARATANFSPAMCWCRWRWITKPGIWSARPRKYSGFIGGTSDKPAPISEKEAQTILQRVQDGVDKPKPKVLYEPGEMVRVNDGPFNDFEGMVEEVNYERAGCG
jgi:transcription antitermination factor NusG